jgi:FSR family fosmidomycin resistance protein-like MFS transporter
MNALPKSLVGQMKTSAPVLGAVSFCHLLNDMMQSLLPAIYPILKGGFNLNFGQIGILTFVFQLTASLLQPFVGWFTDKRPQPYSLAVGMSFTMLGLLTIAYAGSYALLILGAALLGLGSSIFHPESSRVARLASGGRHGLAQSVFQVGGNFGQALGPLLAAFIVLPHGRSSIAWFALAALGAMMILTLLGRWYRRNAPVNRAAGKTVPQRNAISRGQVNWTIAVLVVLIFSKYFYLVSITSYYIFYLSDHFGVPTQAAQTYLFLFLAATAAGTLMGGLIGDRFGRKAVIWGSILGVAPFTLVLPYVSLQATIILTVIIGFILSSAFPAIIIYAQELMPGRVGMVSGIFFGFAFGLGGIGAAVLGEVADWTSIDFVYRICAFLPLIGFMTVFLPNTRNIREPIPA